MGQTFQKKSQNSGPNVEQTLAHLQWAVIREVNNNNATVELEDGSVLEIKPAACSMVAPKEHDIVLVTGGADVGVEGELVCIDGTDAILKDSNEDFKIVDLIHLAKIDGEAYTT